MRILIADDERDLNNIISKNLKMQGHSVDSVFNGLDALEYIRAGDYDAVILDIMMPGMDGLTVLRTMRRENNLTAVLMLTAKDSISDRVTGLDSGANDYLIKPFSLEELSARIRVLGRKASANPDCIYTVGDLSVNTSSRVVRRGDKDISLTPKEFALLEYLVKNKGKVVSHAQIENNLWNFDFEGDPGAVIVYIRYLRRKIDDGFDVKLIHTVRGSGYVIKED
ncbi:MAG: response regulator transcription factor [Clostridia bacterium]|nr:response regulator transcription factor [Clostridia bacterium]